MAALCSTAALASVVSTGGLRYQASVMPTHVSLCTYAPWHDAQDTPSSSAMSTLISMYNICGVHFARTVASVSNLQHICVALKCNFQRSLVSMSDFYSVFVM